MRRCQRIGCPNSLDHTRVGARYCGPTCKREAARSRRLRDGSASPKFWDRYALVRRARRGTRSPTGIGAGILVLALLLAGCGGGKPSHHVAKPPTVTPAVQLAESCPSGNSQMGCAVAAEAKTKLGLGPVSATPTIGPLFPDVYEGQGGVDWQAVKAWQQAHGWKPAAIFKLGEYVQDSQAARNAQQTKALGFWQAGYWFVRNTGCIHEASQIITVAHTLALRVVVLDMEVPEAGGYGGCLGPVLTKAGFIVVIYTAPGTWPGGSGDGLDAWIASYGPASPPAAPWGGRVVAFQFTDGVFGFPVAIPTLGNGDVSQDLGITSLGVAPPPDPFAVFPKAVRQFGTDHASEYNTAKRWRTARCLNPVRRDVCKSTRAHLVLLLGRINFLAYHRLEPGRWVALKHPRWNFPNRRQPLGARAALIRADLRQR